MPRNLGSGLLLAICLGGCSAVGFGGNTPATAPEPAPQVEMTSYERALDTVAKLKAAGNEQIAIDRLTQLLSDPDLTEEQTAEALLKRAELRAGQGNDLDGAMKDAREILTAHPTSSSAGEAETLLEQASAEHDRLTASLSGDALSTQERFETLFRLGRHQDAGSLMFAGDFTPGNQYLLDMYQVGYLCEGNALAGPSYTLVEPDGTERNVQFCDTPE